DLSFGHAGNVVLGNPARMAQVSARQPDGKLVVAGVRNPQFDRGDRISITRYNADGSVDKTFGGKGTVTTDFFASADEVANAVAIQKDGRILLLANSVEQSSGHPARTLLARFTSTGALDNSFASGGKFIT